MESVYLLTGKPGTGKTSLIKEAVAGMKGKVGGFYTEEIRTQGVREGFRLVTLAGDSIILAHINFDSPQRVSKYGVDIARLEQVGVPALKQAAEQCDLVVIDEIGKMEIFSDRFRETVAQIIASGKKVMGTIMLSPNPWADNIKHQPRVKVITLTRARYQEVRAEVRSWMNAVIS